MAQIMNTPYSHDYSKAGTNKEKEDPACTAYDKLQQDSCECADEDKWDETFEKRLKTFYKLYNKEKLVDGEIKDFDQVKAKWGGKESEMFLELTKKYKDKAIEKRVKSKDKFTPPEEDTESSTDAPETVKQEEETTETPASESPFEAELQKLNA